MLPPFALAACLAAPTVQRVRFEVAAVGLAPDRALEVQATWLGEERQIPLMDDGAPPDLRAGDGRFTGEAEGGVLRLLPVRVLLDGAEAWAGVEPVPLEGALLAWSLEVDAPPRAQRVALSGTARQGALAEVGRLGLWFGWLALALGLVAWLVRRAERSPA